MQVVSFSILFMINTPGSGFRPNTEIRCPKLWRLKEEHQIYLSKVISSLTWYYFEVKLSDGSLVTAITVICRGCSCIYSSIWQIVTNNLWFTVCVKAIKMKHNHQKQPVTPLPNPSLITQLHSDKGIIQIGSDETATNNFILTVYVGQAVNLDLVSYLQYSSYEGFL